MRAHTSCMYVARPEPCLGWGRGDVYDGTEDSDSEGSAGPPRKPLVWSLNEKPRPEHLPARKKQQLAKVAASPLNVCVSKITSSVWVQFDPFNPETRPGAWRQV